MFAFTKEQKQAKLARRNVDNYNKLEFTLSNATDSLQREAILNAMADIVDIFTLLRSTYDLSKPIKTAEDYRLLRVPGMPGIVIDCITGKGSSVVRTRTAYFAYHCTSPHLSELQQYFIYALQNKKLKEMKSTYEHKSKVHGVTTPFSQYNFDTLLSLEEILDSSGLINIVEDNYNRETCEQFAHHNNIDIIISI